MHEDRAKYLNEQWVTKKAEGKLKISYTKIKNVGITYQYLQQRSNKEEFDSNEYLPKRQVQ